MSKPKIYVSSNDLPESSIKILINYFEVVINSYAGFDPTEMEDSIRDTNEKIVGAAGVLWSSNIPLTKEMIEKAGKNLKIVATASSGFNHIATDELKARGIKFSNAPDVLNAAVAEIAVSLIIAVSRRFTESFTRVKSGVWAKSFKNNLGSDIRGSTVGIIGLGGIGQAIVKRLSGFEVGKFIYSGHTDKPEAESLNAIRVSQDELLRESDYIILACPLTDETKEIINKKTLKQMKSSAILINIGRGDLVEQDALYTALKDKTIWGAGLDVTTPEPLPADHPLLKLPNVFILPHIGSDTIRTKKDIAELAANNIVNGIKGLPLLSEVEL